MCFDFVYNFCLKHFHSRSWAGYDQKCIFLSDFNGIWIFSTDFRKIHKHQISWKSGPWGPSCSKNSDGRTDGRTDRQTKLTVAFRTFATDPKSFRSRLPKWSATPNQVSTHALELISTPMKNSFPIYASLAT